VTTVATETGVRDWWLRTLLVLQSPRAVFVALRDESAEAVSDRSEQVLMLVWVAGIAYALATPTAGSLLDDSDYDGLLIAVWAFIAGGIVGTAAYWAFGLLLQLSVRLLGSQGSYRRMRHVLAFASAPIVLSLLLLPVRLALYGEDIFRSGGSDAVGHGAWIFGGVDAALAAWALVLLAIGLRAVHGWSRLRAGVAFALPAAVVAVVVHLAGYGPQFH
jgi:hypothetical protein